MQIFPHHPRAVRSTERGMTLIEISVVLLIIGLATGGVLVGIDGFLPEARVRGVAREVGAQLRLARTLAWSRGQPYWIEYDLRERRMRTVSPYVRGSDPLRLAQTPEQRDFMGWYELVPQKDWEKLEIEIWYPDSTKARGDQPVVIRFDPRGTFAYHFVVMIDKSEGKDSPQLWKYFTLEVRGFTGDVEFYAGLPEIHAPSEADFFG
ncbi:MAG: prepilin-type N-terminal cleavage/methylation domain-containing protein [Planctomycetes bacterium]|nr:prepilin-type N-terminal cleavage/methylation domain-containing protein [Planctomycetota bacterium]